MRLPLLLPDQPTPEQRNRQDRDAEPGSIVTITYPHLPVVMQSWSQSGLLSCAAFYPSGMARERLRSANASFKTRRRCGRHSFGRRASFAAKVADFIVA